MVYAVFFLAGKGAAFAPPEPFELAKGDYFGSMGPGEPSSWEKAAIYVVIALVLVLIGSRIHQFGPSLVGSTDAMNGTDLTLRRQVFLS